ncbi:MAG TPA: hypothetical protein QF873_00625 [Patescibacteria group bacterium]|nr:hypothetical protein [Patescibacteria group bacterium]
MEELTLEQKAKELGELLANTTFPQKVVEKILDNLSVMTEGEMDILLDALRNERDRLFKLSVMMADFAEYVDDKMDAQTATSLQEIADMNKEQEELMAQDKAELVELLQKAKAAQAEA